MPTTTAPPVATSVDSSAESATTSLYRAAIGPINNDYYLPIFTRFEAADRAGPSWNWAASLYTLNWMAFRHLWGAAMLYLAALAVTAILALGGGRLLFQLSESGEWGLWLALAVLGFVLPGMFGNALLHAASRKKMARALSDSGTLREACAMLNQQASSRQRFIWLAVANLALAGAAAGAYVVFAQNEPLPLVHPTPVKALNLPTPAASVPSAPAAPASASPAPAPALEATSAPAPAAATQADWDAMAAATSRYVSRQAVPAETAPAIQAAPSNPKPKPTVAAATPAKHYAINVGLFASDANARNAHTKLRNARLPASIQEIDTPKGHRTRVRVGPFSTRSEADAAVRKIRALQLDAVLVKP